MQRPFAVSNEARFAVELTRFWAEADLSNAGL